MKKLFKYIYLVFAAGLLMTACVDEDAVRFDIDDMQEAVNLRIQSSSNTFDATDPEAGTTFTMYSINDDLSMVEMYVRHFKFATNEFSSQVKFGEIDGNTITNDGSTTLEIPLTDLTNALGITPDGLSGGDVLTIYSIVTLDDGRVYPDTILVGTQYETLNVDAGIIGNSATHSFSPQLNFPIVCPLDEGFATGDYMVEVVEGSNSSGFGPVFGEGVYTLTADGNTRRTFTVSYIPNFGFAEDMSFDFACNITLARQTDTGIGCGGPTLTWTNNNSNAGTFDISDDSEFTVSIFHDITDACGASVPANTPMVLKFTKQ